MTRKKAPKERIEPRFSDDDDDHAPPLVAERRAPRRKRDENQEEQKPSRRKEPKRRRRSLLGFLFYWGLVLATWGMIGAGGLIVYYGSQLPHIDNLAIPRRPPNIAILGVDGSLIANRGDTGGAAIRLEALPPYLPRAFIAIEDRRFYSHWGVDPIGILRALVNDALGRRGMQGGSTLTQQLAKNLFLSQERTLSRKIQEAILALWLERKYSKDRILELYLNRVYFGSGSYGVEAAAEKYFGHPAKDVTLPEAAMLAGLMKAPSRLAPTTTRGRRSTAPAKSSPRWRRPGSSPKARPRTPSPILPTPCAGGTVRRSITPPITSWTSSTTRSGRLMKT